MRRAGEGELVRGRGRDRGGGLSMGRERSVWVGGAQYGEGEGSERGDKDRGGGSR